MNKLLIALMVVFLAACSHKQNGEFIPTETYNLATLEGHLNASPKQISEATLAAFPSFEIVAISDDTTDLGAEIIGRTKQDKKVSVSVSKTAEPGSSVEIQVGTFGDHVLSQQLYNEIKDRVE